ncbi:MAG: urea carboxylase-associated family protein [Rhodospirillaceae bacterium]|nr:urea carboxylase-associated family protein [Rhodospirillaceae bacterium]
MRGKIVEEFVIPARHGRAVVVKRGQVLRIHQIEGGQAGDCVFYNANDTKEWFHVGQSWAINGILKTGTAKKFKYFYSKPPRENVMLTVLADTMGDHWGNNAGRCSTKLYQLRDSLAQHRSCQENLTEALAPHGLTGDDVMDVFNIFMCVDLHPDGSFTMKPSTATKDDYMDLRAEMDVLAAVSACPADTSPTNGGTCKPLGIKIFDS